MQRYRPNHRKGEIMKTVAAKRFYCNSGSRLAPKHAVRIDDNGHKTIVATGEFTNIYEKIQSHKDECDIAKILERCDVEGYEILNKREAISGDVTMLPTSMLEAAQRLQDMENDFNALPLDIRRKFNFSFTEYVAESGKDLDSWASKMGLKKEVVADPPKVDAPTVNEGGEQ